MFRLWRIPILLGKRRLSLFRLFYLFGFSPVIFAQSAGWIYIARSEEGKYYVKRQVDKLPTAAGHHAQWMKIVSPDGSEDISYAEWDCHKRRFRLLQTSSYAPGGKAVAHRKNLDWTLATPESVAEDLFEEACGTPRKLKYALIMLPQVKLRDAPRTTGQVYRTAKRGEIFPLVPFDPVGAWYHVYDPKTLAEYWLHGNAIKIVENDVKTSGR